MDGPQQLDELMPLLERLVDKIDVDELDATTPCANFTVAGVMEHMIGGCDMFCPAFRGEPAASADAAAVDESLHDRWRRAMADLLDAVHTDGAQERTINSPMGAVPGGVFARFVVFDGLIHGYDLATATGQDYRPPDALVAEVDAFARQALQPEMRDGDTFAAETEAPAGATPLQRLVAFSGRQLP